MLEATLHSDRSPLANLLIYGAAAGLAVPLVLYPWPTFAVLGGGAGLTLLTLAIKRWSGLCLWQALAMVALAGYMILNYGFANLTFHAGGIPIIVGHSLMFAALGLALFKSRGKLLNGLRDPAALCLLALLPLAVLHLLVDVPRHGLYAIRDASMFLETIFFLLGLFWSTRQQDARPLLKWLLFIYIGCMLYGMTFPWGDAIQNWSPVSGIFLKIPVIGYYWGMAVQMLIGALFVICLARFVVRWPAWVLILLACAQIFGLAIQQARAMYLGLFLSMLVLLFLGELKKSMQLASILGAGLLIVVFLSSVANVRIQGRIGPVNDKFLEEHFLSLLGRHNTPAIGSIYDREGWYAQTKRRIEKHGAMALAVGEGFGFPLIDFETPTGVAVRQPHNSNLTVLLRLGLLGIGFWIAFNLILLTRFLKALRNRRSMDPFSRNLAIWFFLFYMLLFLEWSVQPGLEFSAGAITFYMLAGFGVGILRRQSEQAAASQPLNANVYQEGRFAKPAVPELVD